MADDPLRALNTTPDPAAPRLTPSRDQPTRRFERALAAALFLIGLAMLARAIFGA